MPLNSTCAGYRCWRKVKDDGTSFHVECPKCDYKKLFCSPVHRSEQEARHNRQCPEQQANQTAAELAGPATASPGDSESVLPQQSSENSASATINGPVINNATAAPAVDDIAAAAAPQSSNASSPTETEPQDREEPTPIDNIAASHPAVSPHPELQSDANVTALSAEMKRRLSMLDSIGEETATTEPESESGAARLPEPHVVESESEVNVPVDENATTKAVKYPIERGIPGLDGSFDGKGPRAKKVKLSHQEEDDDIVMQDDAIEEPDTGIDTGTTGSEGPEKGGDEKDSPEEKGISEKLENEDENRDKDDEEPRYDDYDSDNERRIKKKYRTTKYTDNCTDSEPDDEDESDVEESESESETDSDEEMGEGETGEDETKEPERPEAAYQHGNKPEDDPLANPDLGIYTREQLEEAKAAAMSFESQQEPARGRTDGASGTPMASNHQRTDSRPLSSMPRLTGTYSQGRVSSRDRERSLIIARGVAATLARRQLRGGGSGHGGFPDDNLGDGYGVSDEEERRSRLQARQQSQGQGNDHDGGQGNDEEEYASDEIDAVDEVTGAEAWVADAADEHSNSASPAAQSEDGAIDKASGAQTEAMDVDNELLDSDSPVPKPEEDAIAKGKESHTDVMVTAEEPETDESELDLSQESFDPPGPDPFHTPERAPPKHYPELSKPEVEQRLRDWEEDGVKATLSPGAWEDHEAAIHEFGNLHLNQSQGGPSDERDTYGKPGPSTAAVLTPPGASIDDSMLETSNDHGISGGQDRVDGQGEEQGSSGDGGSGEDIEGKVDYDADDEQEQDKNGRDGSE